MICSVTFDVDVLCVAFGVIVLNIGVAELTVFCRSRRKEDHYLAYILAVFCTLASAAFFHLGTSPSLWSNLICQ